MKRWHSFLTHEWRAKLMALALATLLWLFMRHSISYTPPPPSPLPPPPVQGAHPETGRNRT